MQGPNFMVEPQSRVEFTNGSGGKVDCSVRGNPEPTVEWLAADGGNVATIPGIRVVFGNGTIYFPAFEAEAFRQDVHWAIYKCSAINNVGAVVSRDVTVRAGEFINSFKIFFSFYFYQTLWSQSVVFFLFSLF